MSISGKNTDLLRSLESQKDELCPVCMNNICLCSNPSYKQYKDCLTLFRRRAKSKSWLMHLLR